MEIANGIFDGEIFWSLSLFSALEFAKKNWNSCNKPQNS
jgi:hypothetical protein